MYLVISQLIKNPQDKPKKALFFLKTLTLEPLAVELNLLDTVNLLGRKQDSIPNIDKFLRSVMID